MIRQINNTLLTPKPKPLPKGLIYKPHQSTYKLFENKTGKYIGKMIANVTDNPYPDIYKTDKNNKVFKIYSLEIKKEERKKGWGKYFMDFAKKESHRQNCKGKLVLTAYSLDNVPQIFYKKQGLAAVNKKIDNTLNNCIDTHIYPLYHDPCAMYLPLTEINKPKKEIKTKNFLERIKNFFGFNKK